MLTFHVETFAAISEEIRDLTVAHWEEIAVMRDKIALAINWDLYAKRDEDASLSIATVRAAGVLVGYYISFVSEHPHYAGTKFCFFLDSFFVRRDFRKATVGLQLFETMEASMRQRGVRAMISSTKLHHDVSPLFTAMGWDEIGRQYMKWIGD